MWVWRIPQNVFKTYWNFRFEKKIPFFYFWNFKIEIVFFPQQILFSRRKTAKWWALRQSLSHTLKNIFVGLHVIFPNQICDINRKFCFCSNDSSIYQNEFHQLKLKVYTHPSNFKVLNPQNVQKTLYIWAETNQTIFLDLDEDFDHHSWQIFQACFWLKMPLHSHSRAGMPARKRTASGPPHGPSEQKDPFASPSRTPGSKKGRFAGPSRTPARKKVASRPLTDLSAQKGRFAAPHGP